MHACTHGTTEEASVHTKERVREGRGSREQRDLACVLRSTVSISGTVLSTQVELDLTLRYKVEADFVGSVRNMRNMSGPRRGFWMRVCGVSFDFQIRGCGSLYSY